MKKTVFNEKIELPEGITGSIKDNFLTLNGPESRENNKDFNNPLIKLDVDGNKILLTTTKATKREKKVLGTFKAHIKNMIRGVQKGHVYKLKICSSHFPMSVSINNNELIVKNFFGEKHPRVLKLKEGAETKLEGDLIVIKSPNKEIAGQIAGDIEQLTKITNKDRRVFQDGIYIIEKDGKPIK